MEIVKYDESSKTWINDIDGSSINYTNEVMVRAMGKCKGNSRWSR